MCYKQKTYLYFSILIVFSVIVITTGQNFWKTTQIENTKPEDTRIKIIWCTVSPWEQQKCNNFRMANARDKISVGYDYFKIECRQTNDKEQCMHLLDEGQATLTTLDAGEVFVGGRYNSLVPIAQEVLENGAQFYYSVAVVKKDTLPNVHSLFDLRGTKACFANVETFAGWVVPIYTLMTQGGMDIVDCNNHVKSASKFFGPSCAVNCLTDKYNPIGDNSDRLCQLCIGKIPGGRCTTADPYSGYDGAFRCLLEAGDIAFVKHTTVPDLIASGEFLALSKDSFELFCIDGSRRPIDDFINCNWGKVQSDAIVTSSATSFELRKTYQSFLERAARTYHFNNRQNNTQIYDQNPTNQYDNIPPPVPQYDNFGNPFSRKKRQNFGNFGGQDIPQYVDDRDRYNNDQNRNYFDNRQPENPFARDPQTINRDQFGVNVDPYSDGSFNRNRNNIFGYNNTVYRGEPHFDDENVTFYETFSLFESAPRYGIHGNLLFQDSARGIIPLNENLQTYTAFLGTSMNIIMGIRDCQVNKMTLCVTSEIEKEKCIKMTTALKAQLLKPEMDCYKGHSQIHCMQAIRSGVADVAILDASDVYTAGLNFDLIPFISEMYNLDEPESYVVAVAKESDPSTELTYLRGKYTCHSGINTAAGWVYPLAFLISNGWIRPYGCNSIRAAAEYFQKSCVPGALSTEYNTGVPYDNMCDLCHGTSYKYCRRDASEDYYGNTGAFRCLVEGGGHVAFVTHTTVTENTGGKREEWWARDNLNDDFELLCPDGTRAEINEYAKCNLGKVKSNAIVTRGGYGYNETHINAFINLFLYAQAFYGRKTTDEFSFSMFSSLPPYTNLIFQDATTQLKVIEPNKRHYAEYLGSDFLRARRIVDCHAGNEKISASILTFIVSYIILIVFY